MRRRAARTGGGSQCCPCETGSPSGEDPSHLRKGKSTVTKRIITRNDHLENMGATLPDFHFRKIIRWKKFRMVTLKMLLNVYCHSFILKTLKIQNTSKPWKLVSMFIQLNSHWVGYRRRLIWVRQWLPCAHKISMRIKKKKMFHSNTKV